VAFLDSDDEWVPERLELQVERLARQGCHATVVYCQGYLHDGLTGRMTRLYVTPYEGDVFDRLLTGWVPPTASLFLVKRSALVAAGGFDETLPCAEDTDLWLRLAEASHRFAAVDRPLIIKYEGLDPRMTSDPVERLRAFRIFDGKWRSVIERRLGGAAYRNARAGRLANVQRARWAQAQMAVMKGDRRTAWKHCLAMLAFLPWSRRFVYRALACALFGRRAHGILDAASGGRIPDLQCRIK
jgi:GT2 family glycosyltransferase